MSSSVLTTIQVSVGESDGVTGVVPGVAEARAARGPGIKKELVSASDGLATWRIAPIEPADLYVWDKKAESCEAFGGASCGGIAIKNNDRHAPGTFTSDSAGQHLIVTQSYKEREKKCEITNTAEWSVDPDGSPKADGGRVTASYRCSGASVLGWPLLSLLVVIGASTAWYVRRRMV